MLHTHITQTSQHKGHSDLPRVTKYHFGKYFLINIHEFSRKVSSEKHLKKLCFWTKKKIHAVRQNFEEPDQNYCFLKTRFNCPHIYIWCQQDSLHIWNCHTESACMEKDLREVSSVLFWHGSWSPDRVIYSISHDSRSVNGAESSPQVS